MRLTAHTLAHRTAATLLALISVLTAVPPTSAAPVPPPFPTKMAALGDSITRAFHSSTFLEDAPADSWSTGTNAAVNSLYTRFGATTGTNLAVTGAEMADLNGQAAAVNSGIELVTILIGANDICASSEAAMTPVATFEAQFITAMNTLTTVAPGAEVYVVSIPDVLYLWTLLHTDWGALFAWDFFNICQSLLANATSMAPADIDRRARVRQRNIDFNGRLAAVCAVYPKCRTDGNAVFNGAPAASDISTIDYFHPTVAGQTKLAALAWGTDTIGGKNLRIGAPGPAITLTWDGGNQQVDYLVARAQLIPAAPTTFSAPLPANATSYTDPTPPTSSLLCYQVVARDGGGAILGLSDFDCGYTGFAGGTVIPGDFTLGLNQTTTAHLSWTAPAGGPVDGYALYRLPFDGSPITFEALGAGATSSMQNMGTTHYCYTLVAFRGPEVSNTNLVCGIQGFSSLSLSANATPSVGGTMDGLQQTLGDLGSQLGALRQ